MDLTDTPDVRNPGEESPSFDEWKDPEELLKGRSIRERMLDVILQLYEPTKVAEIAERAGCDTETARDYLEWFAEMGIVYEHTGRPVRYESNRSYLRWRRVERIRSNYSEEEIVEALESTLEEIEQYRARFDAEHPSQVSLREAGGAAGVEETWEELSTWKTIEKRAELLDEACRERDASGSGVGRIDA